jgi:hypothetical protein
VAQVDRLGPEKAKEELRVKSALAQREGEDGEGKRVDAICRWFVLSLSVRICPRSYWLTLWSDFSIIGTLRPSPFIDPFPLSPPSRQTVLPNFASDSRPGTEERTTSSSSRCSLHLNQQRLLWLVMVVVYLSMLLSVPSSHRSTPSTRSFELNHVHCSSHQLEGSALDISEAVEVAVQANDVPGLVGDVLMRLRAS